MSNNRYTDLDSFTGTCKIEGHSNNPLKFLCKTHNVLCCGLCICPKKLNNYGQHNGCEICSLEEEEEEMKSSISKSVKSLEHFSKKSDSSIRRLRELIKLINENKNKIKEEIKKTFESIRKELTKRENELVREVDQKYAEMFINDSYLSKMETLKSKIEPNMKKARITGKYWNKDNLAEMIFNCLAVENNIKSMESISSRLDKIKDEDVTFGLCSKTLYNQLIDIIRKLEVASYKKIFNFRFLECPKNMSKDKIYKVVGDRKNIIKKASGATCWQVVRCANVLPLNEEISWKVKILKSKYNCIMGGVCPSDMDMNTASYNDCGWNYYFYNSTVFSGPPQNCNGVETNIPKCTEIQITMNTKEGRLTFSNGNHSSDCIIEEIPLNKKLVPSVCIYDNDDEVEIDHID